MTMEAEMIIHIILDQFLQPFICIKQNLVDWMLNIIFSLTLTVYLVKTIND